MEEDVIGIRSVSTGIGSAGVGFVVVPDEKEREQYIENCYRTNTLTINGGKGYGFFRSVHTDVNVMQNITFPNNKENRGTAVIWVRDAITQVPIIVGSLRKQDEYYSLNENQFRLKRENINKTRAVEVFMDGDVSCLDINILGDEEKPANLNIKINSKNKDSVLNINCDNEINVFSEKAVKVESNEKISVIVSNKGETKGSLTYEREKGFEIISEQAVKTIIRDKDDNEKMTSSYEVGKGFVYKDEFENEVKYKDGEIEVISKKIKHNNGGEPMVLGNTLKGILDDTISAITKLTVPTALGPSGVPLNIAEFKAIAAKLDSILSKKSNLE